MGITHDARPMFSQVVRKRGEAYAAADTVRLVNKRGDRLHLEVDGSRGACYDVFLERVGDGAYYLECSCPHFEGGDYCKHLWASAVLIDELGLFDDGSAPPSDGRRAKRAKRSQPQRNGAIAGPPDWKQRLDRLNHRARSSTPPAVSQGTDRRVFYLLEVMSQGETPRVLLFQQQRRKNGDWGRTKPLRADHASGYHIGEPEDRHVLGLLLGNRVRTPAQYESYDYYSPHNSGTPTCVELTPELYGTVLPALAATGRFVWLLSSDQDWEDAAPIAWDDGEPWRFRLRATRADRRRKWRLTGELTRGDYTRPLDDAVRCFSAGLVLMDDQLSRFAGPADFRWVESLASGGEMLIPVKDREALLDELWRMGEPPDVAGDDSLCPPCEVGAATGRLVVHPPRERPRYARDRWLYASVGYLYDGRELAPHSASGAWLADDGARMIARDQRAEADLFNRLLELGLTPKEPSYYGDTPPGHVQLAPRRLEEVVDALASERWVVEAEGARVRGGGSVSVNVRSGIDWFDVDGQVDFDGVTATLPELLAAVRSGERYIRLSDGARGLVPKEWRERFAALGDLSSEESDDGGLRFQKSQALLLDSLLSARQSDQAVEIDRQFAAWRRKLESFAGVKPANQPRGFRGQLRDYQREGLGWLRFLEKFGFGGCLADDMGLGKTVQVLALLAGRRARRPRGDEPRPSLVVAPKSLVYNWLLEAERFSPRLNVADYVGTDRAARVGDFAEFDLVLTTYGTLRQDVERLGAASWDYVILDEAQAIKNSASQSAKASRVLRARCRLALSGTPVENHLGELWSIFEFLNPGMLGKSRSLSKLARGQSADGDRRIQAIRQGVAPFLLRRTKQQVLPQLPKKSEQNLYCELPPTERKQYNELRDHYRASLDERIAQSGLAKAKIHVLEALLRLRQAACHPGLIDTGRRAKTSAKLSLLMEQLAEVIDEGHKALVFSQFTTMLGIVRDRLDKAGVVYEYLDGKTRDRQARVERFQTDDDCRAFLISLKAGGTGLNLTAADYVFLLDPWWNPAVETQAIDRAHRIGQDKPVFAYRLIARDTVEEKILELQKGKRELADAIVSADSSLLKRLTADDLRTLLG